MREIFNSQFLEPKHAQFLNLDEYRSQFQNTPRNFRFDDVVEMYGKQIFLEYKVTNSWWALRDQIMHFKSSIDDVLWQPNSFFYLIFQFQGEDVREFLNSIWRTELEGKRQIWSKFACRCERDLSVCRLCRMSHLPPGSGCHQARAARKPNNLGPLIRRGTFFCAGVSCLIVKLTVRGGAWDE